MHTLRSLPARCQHLPRYVPVGAPTVLFQSRSNDGHVTNLVLVITFCCPPASNESTRWSTHYCVRQRRTAFRLIHIPPLSVIACCICIARAAGFTVMRNLIDPLAAVCTLYSAVPALLFIRPASFLLHII